MKYVVYLENDDHYLEQLLWCFNSEVEAQAVIESYWDIYKKFAREDGLYSYTLEHYTRNNTGNKSHAEVVADYWESFGGCGVNQWLVTECDKRLYDLVANVGLSLMEILYNGYELHVSSVKEV